ncbi:MAG: CBS domain-containing protein [Methanotrichaceae archaeon]|nr:CBS domain-containing protein [Methanotrichaceae archaeon]
MKVRDVMNTRPIAVQATDTVGNASKAMRENKISGMPVLDGEKVVGVISESDLLKLLSVEEEEGSLWLPSPFEIFEIPFRDLVKWERMQAGIENVSQKKVREVMSRSIHEIGPDDTVERAAEIMTRHKINRLPVVENGRLVGIVTRGDIISGLGTRHEED